MNRSPGLKAVASAAGVSTATVSNVLNDRGRVGAATRHRVLQVADELGYVVNHQARGLRRDRSDTVALIGERITTTPWVGEMIAGVHEAAARHDTLLLILSNETEDPELARRQARHVRERQVDGVIYASMYHKSVQLPDALSGVPVVLLDATSADRGVPSVVPDEVDGGRLAASELVAHGHRRIAFINTDAPMPAAAGRLRGVRDVVSEAGGGVDLAVAHVPGDSVGAYRCTLDLLRRPDRPTGIFCFNDRMASGCYQAAAELGLRIPVDLSVVGFDDMRLITETLLPTLTSVALPQHAMGEWAVDQLFSLLADGAPVDAPHLRMTCPLVRRSSVSAPPTT